jgi:hypothetical protein
VTKAKRLFAGASASSLAATAIVAGTVALATPAQADAQDCRQYLANRGYTVGTWVRRACSIGQSGGGPSDFGMCVQLLRDLEVSGAHAVRACNLADS